MERAIRRRRGSVSPAFTKSWPAPSEWRQRLGDHGLETVRTFERTVRLTQYSFETIGAYAGFASVILSGYPVDIASEALQATAGPTLEAAGIQEVPRLWLEVTARKV